MQRNQRTIRAGVTLIELLVVVTILVLLMGYATSIVKPSLEDRKSRESAQLLNSYFTNAQAKAAELGRPVGVYLERSANDNNKVLQIYTAVTPPPFVGGSTDSRAMIVDSADPTNDPRAVTSGNTFLGFDLNSDGDGTANNPEVQWIYTVAVRDLANNLDALVSDGLVAPGDTIKFNYMGRHYRIVSVVPSVPAPSTPQLEIAPLNLDDDRNSSPPTHLEGVAVPFQIFRRPQKSIASPIEMPNGMAIDLIASGFGQSGFELNAVNQTDATPVVIMYRASGDLDAVYYNGTKIRPIQPVHLLIGSTEYYSYDTDPLIVAGNLRDRKNRWVTVRPRGGDIFATKVRVIEGNEPNAVDAQNVDNSRLDIRDRQRRP